MPPRPDHIGNALRSTSSCEELPQTPPRRSLPLRNEPLSILRWQRQEIEHYAGNVVAGESCAAALLKPTA